MISGLVVKCDVNLVGGHGLVLVASKLCMKKKIAGVKWAFQQFDKASFRS